MYGTMNENVRGERVNRDTMYMVNPVQQETFGRNEVKNVLRPGVLKEEDVPESRHVNLPS